MKKSSLLFIPVIFSAIWACFRLAGLPEQPHFTPFRLLFILLVIIELIGWGLFYRRLNSISAHKRTRAVLFQLLVLTAIISFILIPGGRHLAAADGFAFKISAFIRQAEPFLVFQFIVCICSGILMATTTDIRSLILENGVIPQNLLIFIFSMLLFGAYFPLRANYYPSHDYSIFSYIGQQILRGKMPYTELWDHKPPVIFYLNALGLKLACGSLVGIWVLEFLAFFIGSLILFQILKRHFSSWIAFPVLLFGMLHYARVFDFGNYTEEFSLFFVICALALFSDRASDREIKGKGFLCGVLCGLAFTCKQNTIGCWIALFLLDFIQIIPWQNRSERFRRILNFWLTAAIGFLLINVAWVIYFAANHALSAYWDVAFRFNFIYSEHSGESRLATMWTTFTFLPSISPYLLLGYIGWGISCFRCCKNNIQNQAEQNPITVWAVIDLPVELILAGLSGMNYQHYFILCIPPLIILTCELLTWLNEHLRCPQKLFRTGSTVLLFLASLPLTSVYRDNYTPRTPSAYTKAQNFLLSETSADEPILVWGSRSAIYVMSERYAPTAYFNERPLYLFPGSIQAEQWEELLSDVENDPPQVIIYTHDSALPFIESVDGQCIIPDGAAYTQPVYQYFCENYRYETTINEGFRDAWEVYRRK